MTNEAIIRYACVTTQGMDNEGIAISYLRALDETGLGVRVMPVGMVAMWHSPWKEVPHVFTTALRPRFINVVCVPPGVPLGAPIRPSQFGAGQASPSEAAGYEPAYALSGLYTVGIPNVAIISGTSPCSDKEVDSLKHYNAVVCPSEEGAEAMRELGVNAMKVAADPVELSRLLSGIPLV